MNEKLKELAEQAGYYLYDLTQEHGIKTVESNLRDEWVTLEKFYELVRQDEREQCAKDYLDDCARAVEAARLEERDQCAKVCDFAGKAGLSAIQCAAAIRGRTE